MGTYNLKIWGDQGPDAQRAPGQFQPNTALEFALYTPQAYTPISSGKVSSLHPCSLMHSDYYSPPHNRLAMYSMQRRTLPFLPPSFPRNNGHVCRHVPERVGDA